MILVKWRPIREFGNLRKDMDRIFEEVFEPFGSIKPWLPGLSERKAIVPEINIYNKNNDIVVKAQVPGVEKKDIDLTITKDSVSLKGATKKEKDIKEEDYYCSESTYGSFFRTIPLPVEVDAARAKAGLKDGVLEITLPKLEEAKAKEVKLKIE